MFGDDFGNSFLGKILGMGQGGPSGGPGPFGALGGGLNGSAPPPSLPPAANNGMPMSGAGPGAPAPGGPLNLSPQGPGGNVGMLQGLLQRFGGGGMNNPSPMASAGANPQAPNNNNRAQGINTIMNALKGPDLKPAQFQPMQLPGQTPMQLPRLLG